MTVTAPAPAVTTSRWRRLRPSLVVAGGVLVLSVAVHLRDPHAPGSWGFCPWLVLTGTFCPGCGGLRAVHDLTDGDLAAAASSNLLVLAAAPLAAGLWLRDARQRWHGVRRPLPPGVVGVAVTVSVVLVTAYWVLRNVPAGAWLTP